MRLALAAGEVSGDLLAAGLLKVLLQQHPNLLPAGIAGPAMSQAGCRVWQPMDALSVMGLWEVLARLPELLSIRAGFVQRLQDWQPDLYLGVDAPDFNFPIEARLKRQGIPTVHYVSPSVWAWREKRVKKIRQSTDHVLCLFPFEPEFYARHDVPATFVGHPFAREIPQQPDRQTARNRLALDEDHRWIALLPGSRMGELKRMAPLFLQAARHMLQKDSQLGFLIPAAGPQQLQWLQQQVQAANLRAPVLLMQGHVRCVMQACETGLIASGTAALEALLCNLPMVVSYRVHPVTAALVRSLRMMKTPWYSLPNILHGDALVDELIQDQARPETLARATLDLLHDQTRKTRQQLAFAHIHQQLLGGGHQAAAEVILNMAGT